MFSIGMDRVFSAKQVRVQYGLPSQLYSEVIPSLAVLCRNEDGEDCYLESQVDASLRAFAKSQTAAKPGRPDTTREIADFVQQLPKGFSWKEKHAACKQQWPDDPRVLTLSKVRGHWRRHYGDKKRSEGNEG